MFKSNTQTKYYDVLGKFQHTKTIQNKLENELNRIKKDYIKFKESDKLYNKGIKIINVMEDNNITLTVLEKTLFEQVALIYFQDANRLTIRVPDYLYHINRLKHQNSDCN